MYTANPIHHSQSLFHSFFATGDASTTPSGPSNIITSGNANWPKLSHSEATLEDEQRHSNNLVGESSKSHRQRSTTWMAHSQSASCPQAGAGISSSPAAMFLSAFSSPVSQPSPLPDAEGEVVAGYTLGKIIGYGGFSTIRKASSPSGGVVAIKIVRKADVSKQSNASLARKRLDHEANVWASLGHEHVLPLFSAVHTPYADYFVTLYCPVGSLYDILKRDGRPALPQDDAGMMFRQVVRGLRYLHEVALLVHRDIKLENILIDESGVCRIGDFGMARKIGEDDPVEERPNVDRPSVLATVGEGSVSVDHGVHRAVSVSVAAPSHRQTKPSLPSNHPSLIRHQGPRHRNSTNTANHVELTYICQSGSLPYAAPELLRPSRCSPNPAQDIWALGILLYALITGKLPFSDSFQPRLQMKILHSPYDVPQGIGRGAERVLKGCLDRNLATRWNIAMVDEVAWGIGWGEEGDDLETEEPLIEEFEEFERAHRPPNSRAHSSSSRPLELDLPTVTSPVDDQPKSSGKALAARSLSRAQRSLSRAPILTDPSSSARGVRRSISRARQSPASPPHATPLLTHSIISLQSSSSSSSNDSFSELETHPSPARERGRRPRKCLSASRSPSPSVVPTTPTDVGGIPFSPSIPLDSLVDGLPHVLDMHSPRRDVSRGRKKFVNRSPQTDSHGLYGINGTQNDVLDVTDEPSTGWEAEHDEKMMPLPLQRHESDTRIPRVRQDDHPQSTTMSPSAFKQQKRAGSTPPTPSSTASWKSNLSKGSPPNFSRGNSARFGRGAAGLPMPITISGKCTPSSRSRSLEVRGVMI